MMGTVHRLSLPDQELLLEKLGIFKISGRDKSGRPILRIIGKFFPARIVSADVVKKYLEEKILPELGKRPFVVVYVHTDVQRSENLPGMSALRSVCDAVPADVKESAEAVYFLHPGLQARLFLAFFGRFLFGGGLYGKVRYVNRLSYLWEQVRMKEVEIPDFVYDHDEELEESGNHRVMESGMEGDYARVYGGRAADQPVSTYSMRCIS
ncbi:uncharacterized protein LOC131154300 [Malania oleifera]|uniref:uncharacterized protein LOC131154300 n=1 Tax=Malania oleifera TaxID=397392 RepID=UPI0025ADB223|nr:uncharacterized protein LOC131154300 [Malania oleifera]